MDCYEKLRPFTEYETCNCPEIHGLILVFDLSPSPISCSNCRRIVDPERLGLTCEIVDSVARWQAAFGGLYQLWLDSGEYERWAKERMLDPQGQVNVDGILLANQLARFRPAQYWWFHDTDDELPLKCPRCQGELQPSAKYGNVQCGPCGILI